MKTVNRRLLYIALPIMVVLVLVVMQRGFLWPGRHENGAQLYAKMCALCHGKAGEGYAAPGSVALANPNFLAVADDAYLFENIARGRPGTRMSAWAKGNGGPLTEDQVRAIVTYIRGWRTDPPVDVSGVVAEGDPARGGRLYAERCAACHGKAGEGRDEAPAAPQGAPSLNRAVFLETASDGFLGYSIAQGRPGTPMPAYAGELTDQEIGDLVALIRSWQE